MRSQKEYILCRQIATYLRYQYPKIIFHFDYAGMHHTKAQAGMMKAIQGGRGWPDLFIAQPKISPFTDNPTSKGVIIGLFIEIKPEGTKLSKRKGGNIEPVTPHIAEQFDMCQKLCAVGYSAAIECGFEAVKKHIDWYLKLKDYE